MTPVEPNLNSSDRWIGYWHSDGAQTITKQGVTYLVYMHIETRPDSTCQLVARREGGNAWAETIADDDCVVTVGHNMMLFEYTALHTTADTSYSVGGYTTQISGTDPEWNTVTASAERIPLIRR